jgi:flagellar motor switch protein FliM
MNDAANQSEPIVLGDGRRPRRVREVDFSRPTKFTPDQQRRFERAHETFCRGASTRLSTQLRNPLLIEVVESDQLTWAAALATAPHPALFVVLGIDELETEIVLAAELPWALRVFERRLGGTGKGSFERDELTEIELAVLTRTFTAIVEQLSLTWADLFGVHLSLRRFEAKASNLHVAQASEPSLTVRFVIRDASQEAAFALAVPHWAIEPVLSKLTGETLDRSAPNAESAEPLRRALAGVDVAVHAQVAALDLRLADVLALEVGSVLPLGVGPDAGVTVCVNSVPVHRARPGRSGGRRAVEILERLTPSR